jgi:transposase-like protein
LKGISTSDFDECLKMLVGDGASSISPTTVVRLKEIWSREFTAWAARSLTGKRYVYFWVDGVYFNIRLAGERQCILVIVAATADGTKELLAVHDGVRESEQSWTEVLQDLKARGLEHGPTLAIGDGALGFWKALDKAFPETARQRCWIAQDWQRPELPAEERAALGPGGHPPDLDGRHARERGQGLRQVRRHLPGQVPEGSPLPREGPR